MMPRTAGRYPMLGDGASSDTVGLERTFSYHFVNFTPVRNCLGVSLDDTQTRRSGNRRDGRLPGRHSERVFLPVWSENGIRAGGAAFIWRPWDLTQGRRAKGTAKYHLARLCLSKRRGAAGSDWALAPGKSSIALERKLEQPCRGGIAHPSAISGLVLHASPHTHSERSSRSCRTVGATPVQIGRAGTPRGSSARSHDALPGQVSLTVVHTAQRVGS